MFPSVIYARDNYLRDDEHGVMMPSVAKLFLEASSAIGDEDRVSWWSNVYGFDMSDCIGIDMITIKLDVILFVYNILD